MNFLCIQDGANDNSNITAMSQNYPYFFWVRPNSNFQMKNSAKFVDIFMKIILSYVVVTFTNYEKFGGVAIDHQHYYLYLLMKE